MFCLPLLTPVSYGSLYSLDWTTGLDHWTGLLDSPLTSKLRKWGCSRLFSVHVPKPQQYNQPISILQYCAKTSNGELKNPVAIQYPGLHPNTSCAGDPSSSKPMKEHNHVLIGVTPTSAKCIRCTCTGWTRCVPITTRLLLHPCLRLRSV